MQRAMSRTHVRRVVEGAKYRQRNRIERFFNKVKNFRRIATRYDKLQRTFFTSFHLAAAFLVVRNS